MKTQKIMVAFAAVIIIATAMTGLATTELSGVHGIVTLDGTGVNGAAVTAYMSDSMEKAVGTGVTAFDSTHGNGYYAFSLNELVSDPPYMHAETDNAEGYAQSEVGSNFRSEAIIIMIYKGDIDMSVPEFATIAIPAAAIIGLFFFFNHRKRKKE